MRTIALHILDLLENSVKAGAGSVSVIFELLPAAWLKLILEDDGPGFPPSLRGDPLDPFVTSRTERRVGLGLSLLAQAAHDTGGTCHVGNRPAGGARVEATFRLTSIDMKPLGDVAEVLADATQAWPELRLRVELLPNQPRILDMAAVRSELEDIPVTHPAVRRFLRETLQSGLAPLQRRAGECAEAGTLDGEVR